METPFLSKLFSAFKRPVTAIVTVGLVASAAYLGHAAIDATPAHADVPPSALNGRDAGAPAYTPALEEKQGVIVTPPAECHGRIWEQDSRPWAADKLSVLSQHNQPYGFGTQLRQECPSYTGRVNPYNTQGMTKYRLDVDNWHGDDKRSNEALVVADRMETHDQGHVPAELYHIDMGVNYAKVIGFQETGKQTGEHYVKLLEPGISYPSPYNNGTNVATTDSKPSYYVAPDGKHRLFKDLKNPDGTALDLNDVPVNYGGEKGTGIELTSGYKMFLNVPILIPTGNKDFPYTKGWAITKVVSSDGNVSYQDVIFTGDQWFQKSVKAVDKEILTPVNTEKSDTPTFTDGAGNAIDPAISNVTIRGIFDKDGHAVTDLRVDNDGNVSGTLNGKPIKGIKFDKTTGKVTVNSPEEEEFDIVEHFDFDDSDAKQEWLKGVSADAKVHVKVTEADANKNAPKYEKQTAPAGFVKTSDVAIEHKDRVDKFELGELPAGYKKVADNTLPTNCTSGTVAINNDPNSPQFGQVSVCPLIADGDGNGKDIEIPVNVTYKDGSKDEGVKAPFHIPANIIEGTTDGNQKDNPYPGQYVKVSFEKGEGILSLDPGNKIYWVNPKAQLVLPDDKFPKASISPNYKQNSLNWVNGFKDNERHNQGISIHIVEDTVFVAKATMGDKEYIDPSYKYHEAPAGFPVSSSINLVGHVDFANNPQEALKENGYELDANVAKGLGYTVVPFSQKESLQPGQITINPATGEVTVNTRPEDAGKFDTGQYGRKDPLKFIAKLNYKDGTVDIAAVPFGVPAKVIPGDPAKPDANPFPGQYVKIEFKKGDGVASLSDETKFFWVDPKADVKVKDLGEFPTANPSAGHKDPKWEDSAAPGAKKTADEEKSNEDVINSARSFTATAEAKIAPTATAPNISGKVGEPFTPVEVPITNPDGATITGCHSEAPLPGGLEVAFEGGKCVIKATNGSPTAVVPADTPYKIILDYTDKGETVPKHSEPAAGKVTVIDPDDDHDGVPNSQDKCLHTPEGAAHDADGCAVAPVFEAKPIEGKVGDPITNIEIPITNDGKLTITGVTVPDLPAGLTAKLSEDNTKIIISGTPTEKVDPKGTYNITLNYTKDAPKTGAAEAGTVAKSADKHIVDRTAPTVTATPITANVGDNVHTELAINNPDGAEIAECKLVEGTTLPAGLHLNPAPVNGKCVIEGVPTAQTPADGTPYKVAVSYKPKGAQPSDPAKDSTPSEAKVTITPVVIEGKDAPHPESYVKVSFAKDDTSIKNLDPAEKVLWVNPKAHVKVKDLPGGFPTAVPQDGYNADTVKWSDDQAPEPKKTPAEEQANDAEITVAHIFTASSIPVAYDPAANPNLPQDPPAGYVTVKFKPGTGVENFPEKKLFVKKGETIPGKLVPELPAAKDGFQDPAWDKPVTNPVTGDTEFVANAKQKIIPADPNSPVREGYARVSFTNGNGVKDHTFDAEKVYDVLPGVKLNEVVKAGGDIPVPAAPADDKFEIGYTNPIKTRADELVTVDANKVGQTIPLHLDATQIPDIYVPNENPNLPQTVPNGYAKVTFKGDGTSVVDPINDAKTYYVKKGVKLPADKFPQHPAVKEGFNADAIKWDPADTTINGDTVFTASALPNAYEPKPGEEVPAGYVTVKFKPGTGVENFPEKKLYVKKNTVIPADLVPQLPAAKDGFQGPATWDKPETAPITGDTDFTANAKQKIVPAKPGSDPAPGYVRVKFVPGNGLNTDALTDSPEYDVLPGVDLHDVVKPADQHTAIPVPATPDDKLQVGFKSPVNVRDADLKTVAPGAPIELHLDATPNDAIIPAHAGDPVPAGYVTVSFDKGTGVASLDDPSKVFFVNPNAHVKLSDITKFPKPTPAAGYNADTFKWADDAGHKPGEQEITANTKYTVTALPDVIEKGTPGAPETAPQGYHTVTFTNGTGVNPIENAKTYFVKDGIPLPADKFPTNLTTKDHYQDPQFGSDKTDPIKGDKVFTATAKPEPVAPKVVEALPGTKQTSNDPIKNVDGQPLPEGTQYTPDPTQAHLPGGQTGTLPGVVNITPDGKVEFTPNPDAPEGDYTVPVVVKVPGLPNPVTIQVPLKVLPNVIPGTASDPEKAGYVKVNFDKGEGVTGLTPADKIYWVNPAAKLKLSDVQKYPFPEVAVDGDHNKDTLQWTTDPSKKWNKDAPNARDAVISAATTFVANTLPNVIEAGTPGAPETAPQGYHTVTFKNGTGVNALDKKLFVKDGVKVPTKLIPTPATQEGYENPTWSGGDLEQPVTGDTNFVANATKKPVPAIHGPQDENGQPKLTPAPEDKPTTAPVTGVNIPEGATFKIDNPGDKFVVLKEKPTGPVKSGEKPQVFIDPKTGEVTFIPAKGAKEGPGDKVDVPVLLVKDGDPTPLATTTVSFDPVPKTADVVEPKYTPVTTPAGTPVKVAPPVYADGKNPDGTPTFAQDGPGKVGLPGGGTGEFPGTVTVNPDGSVDVTPNKDATPGEYTIPVVVTYPDGSKDTVPVRVTVTKKIVPVEPQVTETPAGSKEPKNTPKIKDTDGNDLPPKTGFEPGPGVPDWAHVNPDGTVTVTPGVGVDPKVYQIPVVVKVPGQDPQTINVPVNVTPNLATKDEPKYTPQTTPAGDKVTVPVPSFTDANGQPVKVPDGTKFVPGGEPTLPDNTKGEFPGVVTVNNDGSVDVTPNKDATPGEYTIPVQVNYPDGSSEITPVKVTVTKKEEPKVPTPKTADQVEPKYTPVVTTPGTKVTVVPPTYAGGKNPDGTPTFAQDVPGKVGLPGGGTGEFPGTVTVNPDGSVDVTPAPNAPEGKYTIPVVVTYPDGSKDTVPVEVTVVKKPTSPQSGAPEKITYPEPTATGGDKDSKILNPASPVKPGDKARFGTPPTGWTVDPKDPNKLIHTGTGIVATIDPVTGKVTITPPNGVWPNPENNAEIEKFNIPVQFYTPGNGTTPDKVTGEGEVSFTLKKKPEEPKQPAPKQPVTEDTTPKFNDVTTPAGTPVVVPAPKFVDSNGNPVDPGKVTVTPVPAETTLPGGGKGDFPGTVTVNPDGSIKVVPNEDATPGEYTIPVKVTYPDGSTDIVPVKVTVTPKPEAPKVPASINIEPNTTANGGDTDPKTDAPQTPPNTANGENARFGEPDPSSGWTKNSDGSLTHKSGIVATIEPNTGKVTFVAPSGGFPNPEDGLDIQKLTVPVEYFDTKTGKVTATGTATLTLNKSSNPVSGAPDLAFTGSDMAPFGGTALALLIAGTVLAVVRRRRTGAE